MLRFRALFALIGAAACLLAALGMEGIFAASRLARKLNDSAAPVLIYRSEIARRLQMAGGSSGDVQISLSWNNRNDLDLSCVDPLGSRIWFADRSSPSGGRLDVDANSNVDNLTRHPVENIYWPYGRAPRGTYTVYVTYYAQHDTMLPTRWRVQTLVHGELHVYRGTLTQVKQREKAVTFQVGAGSSFWKAWLLGVLMGAAVTALWSMALGLLLSVMLPAVESAVWRSRENAWLCSPRQAGRAMLSIIGAACLAGILGQVVFSLAKLAFQAMNLAAFFSVGLLTLTAHLAGFIVLGIVLGSGLGGNIPFLAKSDARLAGFFAGIGAALLYIYWPGSLSGMAGRTAAALLLGFAYGWMIKMLFPEHEDEEPPPPAADWLEPMHIAPQRASAAGRLKGL